MDHHPAGSDEDSAPESISNTKNWLNWSCDLDNANAREDEWEADNESDIELDNCIQDPESPEKSDVSATTTVPGSIRPTPRSKKLVGMQLMTVNAIESRRNKGKMNKSGKMRQHIFTRFSMLLDPEFHLDKYYGSIVRS